MAHSKLVDDYFDKHNNPVGYPLQVFRLEPLPSLDAPLQMLDLWFPVRIITSFVVSNLKRSLKNCSSLSNQIDLSFVMRDFPDRPADWLENIQLKV